MSPNADIQISAISAEKMFADSHYWKKMPICRYCRCRYKYRHVLTAWPQRLHVRPSNEIWNNVFWLGDLDLWLWPQKATPRSSLFKLWPNLRNTCQAVSKIWILFTVRHTPTYRTLCIRAYCAYAQVSSKMQLDIKVNPSAFVRHLFKKRYCCVPGRWGLQQSGKNRMYVPNIWFFDKKLLVQYEFLIHPESDASEFIWVHYA